MVVTIPSLTADNCSIFSDTVEGFDLSVQSSCQPWSNNPRWNEDLYQDKTLKKQKTNSEPQSEVMWAKVPYLKNMSLMKTFASLAVLIDLLVDMNIACLVKQSTTTEISVKPWNSGSCSMKSIDINFQSCEGIGNCLSSL